jgi:hypothetical protein
MGAVIYAAAQPQHASGPYCSLETTAGDWAFQDTGKSPNGDIHGVGTIHIAKDGTITGHGWLTIGGVVSSEFYPAGTTTVAADCTSTGTFEGTPPYHCVIFANRTKMWCVYEAPQEFTVTLEKISHP